MFKGRKVEVVLSLVTLYLIFQVPRLLSRNHPVFSAHQIVYLEFVGLEVNSVRCLTLPKDHCVQEPETWQLLGGSLKLVKEKDKVALVVLGGGLSAQLFKLLVEDDFWVEGGGNVLALRASAAGFEVEKVLRLCFWLFSRNCAEQALILFHDYRLDRCLFRFLQRTI